jgi:hypothetical protein
MLSAFFLPGLSGGCPRSARTLAEDVEGWPVQRAQDEGKVMLRGALSLVLSLCSQRKNNNIEKDLLFIYPNVLHFRLISGFINLKKFPSGGLKDCCILNFDIKVS